MQQVFVIHGGTSFDTQAEYLAFIKTRELTLEKLRHRYDWKALLPQRLGEKFDVLQPKMPNATNARYEEWKMWLERCANLLSDDVILIGHSLGGIFLAKYLAEQQFAVRIRATILVAAPMDDVATEESLTDFQLPESLARFASQGGDIYIVHSEDDPVVPFADAGKYIRLLPKAKELFFTDRGHFNQEEFPELVALIRSL